MSAGRPPDCVHAVVVPFPGGFSVPTFCFPALGFTVGIEQTGCGIGQIDSNGGADYTVTEVGDTSDSSSTCNLPHAGCTNGTDSAVRVNVTVGDGMPDTCAHGTANAILSVPVLTTVWIEHSSGDFCGTIDPATGQPNGADGTFDPGPNPIDSDVLVMRLRQIRDLTTDTVTAYWADLDGDGCTIAGRGPVSGFSITGVCLDLEAATLTTADAEPVGSTAAPLFDGTYPARAPTTISGPDAPLGATCALPPDINFHGTATRCIAGP